MEETTMTTIQIPIEENIKAEADTLFATLGLDTSTAVKMFIMAAIEKKGLPFSTKTKNKQPNAETLEAMEDARLNRNLYGPFSTVDEAMKFMLED